MADVKWSDVDKADLVAALDLKLASLIRAKNGKSAEQEFVVMYQAVITRVEALKARVKSL